MKKIILISIILIMCVFPSPIKVHAYSNASKLEVNSYNFTDEAYYVDLIVKMDANDVFYTGFNNENMDQFEFDKTKLLEYNEDGYISYSCHYKGIYTNIRIDKKTLNDNLLSINCFTLDKNLKENIYVMKDIYDEKRSFKIAILDNEGNIIQVSDSFEVYDKKNGYIASDIRYDVSNNELEFDCTINNPNDSGIKIYNKPLLIGIVLFFVVSISFLIFRKLQNNR